MSKYEMPLPLLLFPSHELWQIGSRLKPLGVMAGNRTRFTIIKASGCSSLFPVGGDAFEGAQMELTSFIVFRNSFLPKMTENLNLPLSK